MLEFEVEGLAVSFFHVTQGLGLTYLRFARLAIYSTLMKPEPHLFSCLRVCPAEGPES